MRPLLLCLLLIAQGALAQVYTYIDAEGNRVFTDKPRSSSAQPVILAPSNSVQLNQPGSAEPPAGPAAVSKMAIHYQLLRILVPEPDASVHNASGDLIVTATSEPGLLPGHSYRLLLDGQVQGEPSRSPVFPLQHVDRGTHLLAVEIIDAAGLTVGAHPAPALPHAPHVAGAEAQGQPLPEGRLRRAPRVPAEGQAQGRSQHPALPLNAIAPLRCNDAHHLLSCPYFGS